MNRPPLPRIDADLPPSIDDNGVDAVSPTSLQSPPIIEKEETPNNAPELQLSPSTTFGSPTKEETVLSVLSMARGGWNSGSVTTDTDTTKDTSSARTLNTTDSSSNLDSSDMFSDNSTPSDELSPSYRSKSNNNNRRFWIFAIIITIVIVCLAVAFGLGAKGLSNHLSTHNCNNASSVSNGQVGEGTNSEHELDISVEPQLPTEEMTTGVEESSSEHESNNIVAPQPPTEGTTIDAENTNSEHALDVGVAPKPTTGTTDAETLSEKDKQDDSAPSGEVDVSPLPFDTSVTIEMDEDVSDDEDNEEGANEEPDSNKESEAATVAEDHPKPTNTPTTRPTTQPTNFYCPEGGYCPGHLVEAKNGLLLSAGLDCRIIARTNMTVPLADGTQSKEPFHIQPDHAATFSFPDDHPTNPGGWVYVSNSEAVKDTPTGGVGSIFFDRQGNVIDYKMVLKGTKRNCGGGKSPWNTWITCEENRRRDGQIYEVDPFGRTAGRKTVLGGETGGQYESFAYDIRDKKRPRFFYTEDKYDGAVRRFTPLNPDWDNPLEMLHGEGVIEYLVFSKPNKKGESGRFEWVGNETAGFESADLWFPNTEGIDHVDGQLFIVSKKRRRLFQLDLDKGKFTSENTKGGAFKGGPDQLTRLVGEEDILYFTEDGGENHPGIHGRDASGRFFMILESQVYGSRPDGGGKADETTGLAFSPNHKHLYVAYQWNGIVFHVWRKDNKSFSGRSIDIKYHSFNED